MIRLGHPLVDSYMELVAARARPNAVAAQAFELNICVRTAHEADRLELATDPRHRIPR